jgi:hypothetical protein
MNLTTATPVEIDTALAEIYTRLYTNWDEQARVQTYIADMEQGLAKKAEGNPQYTHWKQESLDNLLAKADRLVAEASAIYEETLPYEAEYRSRPWSRFFLVKNNGGHIHSSMHCSTCFPTTQFGWLPEISGLTEAEAVAKHGAILCTVCYPSAPIEWTDRRDDSVCPGSGEYFKPGLPHRTGFYSGNWAECSVCHNNQTISKGGKIRKHKKKP